MEGRASGVLASVSSVLRNILIVGLFLASGGQRGGLMTGAAQCTGQRSRFSKDVRVIEDGTYSSRGTKGDFVQDE